MKQFELTQDIQSGFTFLIDNVKGTQTKVNHFGNPITKFIPNVTGFANSKGRILNDPNFCSTKLQQDVIYTPRQDKLLGYAQAPNARVTKDFLRSRNITRRKRFYIDLDGHNNSYNKPKTLEAKVQKLKKKPKIDDQSLDNQSFTYLTSTIKDSKEGLETKQIPLLEYRSKTRSSSLQYNPKQFVAKVINRVEMMSPQSEIISKLEKQNHKLIDLIQQHQSDQQDIFRSTFASIYPKKKNNSFLRKSTLNKTGASDRSVDFYADENFTTQYSMYDTLRQSRGVPSFHLNNVLAFEDKFSDQQLKKIQFYYKRKDVSDLEGRPAQFIERKERKLTTLKIQQIIQNRKLKEEQAYPELRRLVSQSKHSSRRFETKVLSEGELQQKESNQLSYNKF